MFLKRHKYDFIISLLLIAFFFLLRFLFLTRLPIFTDEAIYIRWAQIALHDSSWRFISLTDGKQPLFVWAVMVAMKFIHDPLVAGRTISIFSGFLNMVGLFLLSLTLFKKRIIAYLSSLLYIIFLFAQVQDRLAIYDSMVAAFFIFALFFSILLVRYINLGLAYTLGFTIGAGILTKSSNFFSIYLLPFTLILFDFKQKKHKEKFIRWLLYCLFAIVISQVFYSILRLSPFYGIIAEKNATFVYPVSQWIHHPFTYFFDNFKNLFFWLIQYLNPFYIILMLFGLVLIRFSFKEKALLFINFIVPFIALALFGKALFPRFIFFMVLMLLPITAWALDFIIEKLKIFFKIRNPIYSLLLTFIVLIIFLAYPTFISFEYAIDPINAPLPQSDKSQYVTSWTEGWGISESINYFSSLAKNGKIYIATEGTFGLMPETYEMYLGTNPNIKIRGYWPIGNQIPQEVIDNAKTLPTYFVFYQPCDSCMGVLAPQSWPVKSVFKFSKTPNTQLTIYQVK